jgi:hypothetical protein
MRRRRLAAALAVSLAAMACTPRGERGAGGAPTASRTPAPVASPAPTPAAGHPRSTPPASRPAPQPAPGGEPAGGGPTYVYLNRIEANVLESSPVQVRAELLGHLSDPCVELGEAVVRRVDNTFAVELPASRDPAAICAQMVVPFRRSVALEVRGLPRGTYRIEALGKAATFTLYRDNQP